MRMTLCPALVPTTGPLWYTMQRFRSFQLARDTPRLVDTSESAPEQERRSKHRTIWIMVQPTEEALRHVHGFHGSRLFHVLDTHPLLHHGRLGILRVRDNRLLRHDRL